MSTSTAVTGRVLLARDVMTAPAVTVGPDANLWLAWSAMIRTGLRHLVVAVDGRCVGVVDDRTLFAQWPVGPLALRRRTVSAIMRTRTTCVLPETALRATAAAMLEDGVDAVPVVDPQGRVLGIVTTGDIAAAVARHGVCTDVPAEVACES